MGEVVCFTDAAKEKDDAIRLAETIRIAIGIDLSTRDALMMATVAHFDGTHYQVDPPQLIEAGKRYGVAVVDGNVVFAEVNRNHEPDERNGP